MPTLRVGDVELFYEEVGAGPPLVFLHGLGSSTRDWAFQFEHFSKTHRCVAFDLPGSGRSKDLAHPKGPFSLGGFAAAIAGGMTALGVAPADVVGLSMGGMTSLQLALDAPQVVRSATVVNATGAVVARSMREQLLLGVRSLVTRLLGPRGVGFLVAPFLFPKPEHRSLRAQFARQMAENDRAAYEASSRALLGWSVEDRLPTLGLPVTFIAAEHDYTPVEAKRSLAARMPNARVIVVPDSHHALPVECPAQFNQVLEQVLKTTPVSGRP